MLTITLPDGSAREYASRVTPYQVAQDISLGLAKAAIAARVDDRLVDLSYPIESDSRLTLLTEKNTESLEVIRHSCAHLLAHAVKQLFPEAQVTIGPVIEDGFYYDFAFERPFTPQDLALIEQRMEELAQKDIPVHRKEVSRDEAVHFFRKLGEEYKAKIIEEIPESEILSLYEQGDFTDLCRGPHVPSTGKIKAFKLMRVSGAYWRGDSNNEMLQRIYGTAWFSKKELETYLRRIEEAKERDHRLIAKHQHLFHIQEEAPGMIFWHPKGWTIYQVMQQYISQKLLEAGYSEIRTPQILDRSLWEKSGHWAKFHSDMFTTESEKHDFAVKPMSCPGHVQVFNQGLKSYRDLPLRLAEFGCCHRNEPSGALHGLMRVRQFVQDDAHIFCTDDQIKSEAASFIRLLYEVYADFGFNEILVKVSTRPENRVGSEEQWDKAERVIQEVVEEANLDWQLNPGEGAFYGPKIEFSLKDCLGRVWQCGTLQVDFSMPERLEAHYIAEDGTKHIPVMLHRAILGSFERFIGILIEQFAGAFPVWLAPQQCVVMPITDKQAEYAHQICKNLCAQGFRAITDLRNEKIGFKIREHTLQRIPYQLIVGDREVETGQVAVRTRAGEDMGGMTVSDFMSRLRQEIAQRARVQ